MSAGRPPTLWWVLIFWAAFVSALTWPVPWLVAFGCTVVRTALQFPLSFLPARIAADVQARMRTTLFDAFTRASWAVQSRDREGQLQETMTNQVSAATQGATQVTILINAAFTFLVLTISALALNALAAVIVAVASIVLFGLLRPLRARGVRNARALSKAQVEYAGGIAESIRVAEEVHVFGVVGTQRKTVAVLVRASQELFYRTQVLGRLVANLYQSFIFVLLVAGLGGLYLIGRRHVGSLGGVVLILVRAGTAGQLVQGAYQGLAQSLPFIERIQDTAQRYLDSSPAGGELTLPRVEQIAFEDVGFAYNPGRPVLSGIGFEIDRGEVIGIIGPSGAGKSTLVQLLLQLRVPDHGRYLVNGVEAVEFRRTDWTSQVAYVPQEPRLLHASVAENIRFYRELDDAAVERAAKLARIHDDVIGWPARYETIVGPRADAVSGGQQQRICLARALAARPEVLVLDEPTVGLDPVLRRDLWTTFRELAAAGATLLVSSHVMDEAERCDELLLLREGRLLATGSVADIRRRTGTDDMDEAFVRLIEGSP